MHAIVFACYNNTAINGKRRYARTLFAQATRLTAPMTSLALLALLHFRARTIVHIQQNVNYALTTLHAHTACLHVLLRTLLTCVHTQISGNMVTSLYHTSN